jgi:hypothetical protein
VMDLGDLVGGWVGDEAVLVEAFSTTHDNE